MSAILYLQEFTQINIPLWGIGLTGLGIAASIFFGASSILRASKKDTTEKIEKVETTLTTKIDRIEVKKVDMLLFTDTIEDIEDKISDNKDNVKEHFDLLRRDIGTVQKDIKEILRSINGKRK